MSSSPSTDTPRNKHLRFVVLHHIGAPPPDENHFDLMIELPDQGDLETFRLPHWPLTPGQRFDTERLRNHRRHYLTYQGPVSNNRGHVLQVCEGTAEVNRTGPADGGSLSVILLSTSLHFSLTFDHFDNNVWTVQVHSASAKN